MFETAHPRAASCLSGRRGAASAALLMAAGCLALAPLTHAAGDGARDLTVEQAAVHAVQAPAPAAAQRRGGSASPPGSITTTTPTRWARGCGCS